MAARRIDYFNDCIVKRPGLLKLFNRQRDLQYFQDLLKPFNERITGQMGFGGYYIDNIAEEKMRNFCELNKDRSDEALERDAKELEPQIEKLAKTKIYSFKKSKKSKKVKKSKKSVKKAKKSL